MKTKKIIITTLIISSIFWWLHITNAGQSIYDKVDNLVMKNRDKAEKFYDLLWQIYNYTWEKLWKEDKILDFSNIYWFDVRTLEIKHKYKIWIFEKEDECKSDYYEEQHNLWMWYETWVIFTWDYSRLWSSSFRIYVYKQMNNIIYDSILEKYKKVISWEIQFDSEEFKSLEITLENWEKKVIKYNIFDLENYLIEKDSFWEHFIKDDKWNIKWIWYYSFLWDKILGRSNFYYNIISVKWKSLMHSEINLVAPFYTEDPREEWTDVIIEKEVDWIMEIHIDIEKFKAKFFKDWEYFYNDSSEDEYLQEMKTNLIEMVKNS